VSDTRKAHLQIHVCVFIWGFTAVLGKLIALPSVALVWWRLVVATAALGCLPSVWRGVRQIAPRLALAYAGIGAILAAHWVTFFGAVKLADASVGAMCLGLAPAALALVEPAVARRAIEWREIAFGAGVVPGVALVVRGVPAGMRTGIVVGVVSTTLVALSNALQKRLASRRADPLAVMWIELAAGVLVLTIAAPAFPHAGPALPIPDRRSLWLLIVLAIGCTLLPFGLYLAALRRLSAFTVQLAVILEPVYAIALGYVLLGEDRELGGTFYAGAAVLLAIVVAHAIVGGARQVAEAGTVR